MEGARELFAASFSKHGRHRLAAGECHCGSVPSWLMSSRYVVTVCSTGAITWQRAVVASWLVDLQVALRSAGQDLRTWCARLRCMMSVCTKQSDFLVKRQHSSSHPTTRAWPVSSLRPQRWRRQDSHNATQRVGSWYKHDMEELLLQYPRQAKMTDEKGVVRVGQR